MRSITPTHTPARAISCHRPSRPLVHERPTAAIGQATTVSNDGGHQPLAQIEHIAVATRDLEQLSDFYRQLGAVASPPSTDPDTGARTCLLDFFGIRLEVFERPGSGEGVTGGEGSPGLLHIGFALESADAVDELTGVIAAAGYRVIQPPRRAGELGRYESVVLDPDGNRLKLTV